ncbi:MAG: hypothetical protein KKA19_03930, partial [Candidatus Margulisbacteria bacterium]|nr:hypothetical protein [Candidatus Margulisiibacteriota bacterium]
PTGTYVLLVTLFLVSILMILNVPLYILRRRLKDFALEQPNKKAPRVKSFLPQKIPARQNLLQKESKKKMFDVLKEMFTFGEENKNVAERPMVKTRQIMRPSKQPKVLMPRQNNLNNNFVNYKLPPLTLLMDGEISASHHQKLIKQSKEDARVLEATLASFKIEAKVVDVSFGPAITRYELQPGPGVRVNRIANLSDDIALNLAVAGVRIEAPVPGKSVVGIEVPNTYVRNVMLSQLVRTKEFQNNPAKLIVALGQDIGGNPVIGNLAEMPHLLIAGATGSGKSVCLNSIIMSLLLNARPDEVKFLMIDPKRIELMSYNNIPHLVAPVIHEPDLAAAILKNWALKEMRHRYDLFARVRAKNIEAYNQYIIKNSNRRGIISINPKTGEEEIIDKIPYVVLIIDELADLMMVASRDVEITICRLAQMARATGIHLVIATQRPSVNVITGLIKANIPSRISFAVQSQIDSRTILDGMGAEKLLGKGDMLYSPVGAQKMTRVQGVFVTDKEIHSVVRAVKAQGKPQYIQQILEIKPDTKDGGLDFDGTGDGKDPYFEQAEKIVTTTGKNSISYLQRKLRIGYNRAARIMEELEEAGVVKAKEAVLPPEI